MIFLFFLIYPFAELYAFYLFIQAYSFLDALFFVILSGFLGLLILQVHGRKTLLQLQQGFSPGQVPEDLILHRGLILFSGILLMIPGIISDGMALLCLLPGSRHMLVWYLKQAFKRGMLGQAHIFVAEGFGFRTEGFPRQEKDAQVIDVNPIEITHENKKS